MPMMVVQAKMVMAIAMNQPPKGPKATLKATVVSWALSTSG